MPSRELAIIGCGGHGITVLDVVLDSNPEADIIFLDENAKSGETIVTKNPPRVFEVAKKMVGESAKEYFVAIGDNQKRKSISHSLGKTAFATIIAKDSLIGMDAQIESGSFIGHQAIVGPLAWVGEGTIINTRSHISHEVRVGRYSQLALDVTVGGRTEIACYSNAGGGTGGVEEYGNGGFRPTACGRVYGRKGRGRDICGARVA